MLGLGFGVSVTLGNTIGAGIMGTPGEIAARIPVPALIIAVWVAGGVPLESALGLFSFFFSDRLICFNISSAPVSPGTALDCSSALAAAGDIRRSCGAT